MKSLRFSLLDTLFIVLLLFCFFIRINNLDYPLENGEVQRDYLVAHNIVNYRELPLAGTLNGELAGLRNSPIYFYFLSLFLFLKDDILFLGLINIFLQLLTINIIYLLAKNMFNGQTALIAAAIFGLSNLNLQQSLYAWQPYVMQTFANLSYLLLLLAHLKKNYSFLILAIITFIFSGAIHNSAFAIAPIFFVAAYLILSKIKSRHNVLHYLVPILVAVIFLLIFYLPVVLTSASTMGIPSTFFQIFKRGFSLEMLDRIFKSFSLFIDSFFFTDFHHFVSLNYLLLATVLVSITFYLLSHKSVSKKYFLILLTTVVFEILLFGTFFKINTTIHNNRQFTPVFALTAIVIARAVTYAFSTHPMLKTIKYLVIILLINTVSMNFFLFHLTPNQKNLASITAATQTIKSHALIIRSTENIPSLNFFQIKHFTSSAPTPNIDSIFWLPLEKEFNQKFTAVTNFGDNYTVINDDTYIFLVCSFFPNESLEYNHCLQNFMFYYKNYAVLTKLYTSYPFSIYLAKKQQDF